MEEGVEDGLGTAEDKSGLDTGNNLTSGKAYLNWGRAIQRTNTSLKM
jgi:hypothetical protein